MRRSALFAPVVLSVLALAGCAADAAPDMQTDEGAFSSNQATLLDFDFDAELTTDSSWNDQQTIQDQLLYTIGHLNADKSVGRLDNLVLSNVRRTQANGTIKIAYHAKLPVAWGSKTNLPAKYQLALPKDVSTAGLSTSPRSTNTRASTAARTKSIPAACGTTSGRVRAAVTSRTKRS